MFIQNTAISSLPPQLDDSLLPAEPAWSFVFAYEDVRGRGATHAALAIAGQLVMPDTWHTWIDPLSRYVILGNETAFRALPYSRLALLAYAVAIEWSHRPRVIEAITRHIGRHWWSGNNLIGRGKPFVNMQTHLGGTIQHRVHQHKHLTPHAGAADAEGYASIALALDACVTTVSAWTGIACHCVQSASAIRVDIDRCPLCLYAPRQCQIFIGLIDGMLAWLDTASAARGKSGRFGVDESRSTGHTIVLDWTAATQQESHDHS